jgi:hypothetical protein
MLYPVAKGTAGVDMAPVIYHVAAYAGGEVEITAASGYLYARGVVGSSASNIVSQVTLTDEALALSVRDLTAAVVFSEDAPADFEPGTTDIYYPVAQVALASGVASIVEQLLDHNPTHDLGVHNLAD